MNDEARIDLVPDGVLDRMMRDGWVPGEVHRLIESYRKLKHKHEERAAKKAEKANGKHKERDDA